MKRQLFLVASTLIGTIGAFSQSGVWSGSLNVSGTKLPLVFHFDPVKPTMDSPAQGVKGIPIQVINPKSESIVVSIPALGVDFNALYRENKITGIFTQRGAKFPLTLTPGESVSNRPQTPAPPYPYIQESVSFSNGDAVLKGTLTLPKDYNSDTPVLIMVTGSGLQNRDEEIYEHKPFAVIADYLARNGIATLRYDDRGFGESTGDAANCTTEDLMLDALSGINLLRNRFNTVGVLGHSEGGSIAFMLGADNKVDFIVSLAGAIISGKEILLEQNRYMLSQAGYPQQVINEYCQLLASAFDGNIETVNAQLKTAEIPDELKTNISTGLNQLNSA